MVPGATEPLTRPMMLRALGHTVRHILICKGEGRAWQAPADMPAPSPSPALPAPQGAEPWMLLLRVDMMQGRQISHPGECQAHWHYHLQRNAGTIPPDHRPSHPAALFPLPQPSAPPWTPFLPPPHLLSILLTQWEPPTKSETRLIQPSLRPSNPDSPTGSRGWEGPTPGQVQTVPMPCGLPMVTFFLWVWVANGRSTPEPARVDPGWVLNHLSGAVYTTRQEYMTKDCSFSSLGLMDSSSECVVSWVTGRGVIISH